MRMGVHSLWGQVHFNQKSVLQRTHPLSGVLVTDALFLVEISIYKVWHDRKRGAVPNCVWKLLYPAPVVHGSDSLRLRSATVPFPDCLTQSACWQQD